jgi:hypothetical protein
MPGIWYRAASLKYHSALRGLSTNLKRQADKHLRFVLLILVLLIHVHLQVEVEAKARRNPRFDNACGEEKLFLDHSLAPTTVHITSQATDCDSKPTRGCTQPPARRRLECVWRAEGRRVHGLELCTSPLPGPKGLKPPEHLVKYKTQNQLHNREQLKQLW